MTKNFKMVSNATTSIQSRFNFEEGNLGSRRKIQELIKNLVILSLTLVTFKYQSNNEKSSQTEMESISTNTSHFMQLFDYAFILFVTALFLVCLLLSNRILVFNVGLKQTLAIFFGLKILCKIAVVFVGHKFICNFDFNKTYNSYYLLIFCSRAPNVSTTK